MPIYSPSELAPKVNYLFDYATASKSNYYIVNATVGKTPAKFCIVGELVSDGIVHSEEYNNYNIGIVPEDVDGIDSLLTSIAALQLPDDFEIVEPIKNDILWVKLRVKKGVLLTKCFCKVNLKKPEEAPLHSGEIIKLLGTYKVWINFESKKAGIYFQIERINV